MMRALAVLIVLAGIGLGVALYVRRAVGGDAADAVPTVVVAEERLVRKVTAEGNLRAVKATPLSVPRSDGGFGPMKVAWLTPDGQPVAKGDVVVRFDPSEPEKQLRESRGELASATARLRAEQIKGEVAVDARDIAATLAVEELAQTRKFGSKDQEIFSRNQIIESEIDQHLAGARKEHAESTRSIERRLSRSKTGLIAVEQQQAQVAIKHAQTALESMEIRAPHDGLFILRRSWRGDTPKVGDQLWQGQAVAEIPLLETMEVEVFVLEIDGSSLAEKQPAEVVIDARPETIHRGTVRLVDKLAKPRMNNVPVQYFAVVIELATTDVVVMKPGQRVRATITLDEEDALVVPRQAIVSKDGKSYVYRRTARGDFEQVPVELGAATAGRVAVASGLTAGDRIALRDPTRTLEQALGSGDPATSAPGGAANAAGTGP